MYKIPPVIKFPTSAAICPLPKLKPYITVIKKGEILRLFGRRISALNLFAKNQKTRGHTMNIELSERIIFWFMIYSVGGWIYETVLCSVSEKRFVNRGFLNGPYCPIYGFGALLDILLLGRIQNVFALFALGVIVTCTLEYLTSFAMEKLFHARWWDYSKRKFNINGRVCLLGAVVFGAFSVVLVKILHPAVVRLTDILPGYTLPIITAVFTLAFLTDSAVTITGFSGFNKRLAAFSETLAEKREGFATRVQSSEIYGKLSEIYEGFAHKFNRQQRRMIRAFPKLKPHKHEQLLDEIKKHIIKTQNKKSQKV